MPNVTVKIAGGKDKENLEAITVGNQRWGLNGASWGSAQSVPSGNNIQVTAYYPKQQSSVVTTFNLGNTDVVISITADGPGKTQASIT